jgi:predicted  nucleic acid-binding Zn-ribbon protein
MKTTQFQISILRSKIRLMEHNIHTPNNLYTMIKNNENMVKIRAKIETINNKLSQLEERIRNCDRLGLKDMAELDAREFNRLNLEVTLLKLKLNKLEKEDLLFDLEVMLSD